jgi:hypothetical protein
LNGDIGFPVAEIFGNLWRGFWDHIVIMKAWSEYPSGFSSNALLSELAIKRPQEDTLIWPFPNGDHLMRMEIPRLRITAIPREKLDGMVLNLRVYREVHDRRLCPSKHSAIIVGYSSRSIRLFTGGNRQVVNISRLFGKLCQLLLVEAKLLPVEAKQLFSLPTRTVQFSPLINAYNGQDCCEKGDPYRSRSHPPRHLILAGLWLILGSRLMSLAFHICDEPQPPFVNKCLAFGVGFCAIACIAQGVSLICR